MLSVMLDLETLGTRPGSTILSIGAVTFGEDENAIPASTFYYEIKRESCRTAGLVEDKETVRWWDNRRETPAYEIFSERRQAKAVTLLDALVLFHIWYSNLTLGGTIIWSNGADFDVPLLSEAYHLAGGKAPWGFRDVRCYRTLKNLFPAVRLTQVGEAHNALDDARTQAEHTIRLLREVEKAKAVVP